MGHAPLLGFAVHKAADVGKAFPKGSHVKLDRACPVRFPQLTHPLAHEHERHAPPLVALDVIERAPDAVQKGGKVKVVRDNGGRFRGKVFFKHLCNPFGGCV